MSAVACGPGLERADRDEVRAPRGARVWTWVASTYIVLLGGIAFFRANRMESVLRAGEAATAVAMVVPAFCIAVAALALVVREARLRVDADGVRWGYQSFGFRMDRARVEVVRAYRDAVALVPAKGFAWYLSARDWQPFTALLAAFKRAGLPLHEGAGRAPLIARLQSYGPTLDLVLVADVLGVTGVWLLL